MSKIIEVGLDIYLNPTLGKNSDSDIDDHVNDLNCDERVIKFLKRSNIRRGDVAHFEQFGSYRNEGKVMWSGTELIALYDDFDEYGSVPSEFKLEEFNNNKNYFRDSIDHNCLVWINGPDYVITKKKVLTKIENKKIYVYVIENIDKKHKWFAISSLNETRFSENVLELGLFEADFDLPNDIEIPKPELVLYATDLF